MKLKLVVIALSAASLAGCDALSMSGKKQTATQPTGPVAAAPAKAPEAKETKADPNMALAGRVKAALQSEGKVQAAGIDVTAADGVVTLWGTTTTDDEKGRAGKIASGIDGVKSVENRIAVIKGS